MVRKITLTRGQTALVDDEDYLALSKFRWHAVRVIRKTHVMFYARRFTLKFEGRPRRGILMHRVILGIENNPGIEGDHKDGDGLNNVRSNLRGATRQQNSCNQPKRLESRSRFKGVTKAINDERWLAHITVAGSHRSLGFFETEELAARAYDKAAREFFGEFAKTNF